MRCQSMPQYHDRINVQVEASEDKFKALENKFRLLVAEFAFHLARCDHLAERHDAQVIGFTAQLEKAYRAKQTQVKPNKAKPSKAERS